jgi:23S rRNA (uracil1939-C5)-methyltransferase
VAAVVVDTRLEGTVVDAGALEAIVATPAGPVRVRGAVPGDRIRLRVTHRGRNATWGALEEVLAPSPRRVAPRCPLILTCGGCPWQAWDPEAQRAEKRRRLETLLAPHTTAPVREVSSAGADYGYRNKHLVAVGGRPGALRFGLYAPRSHHLVPADACPVQSEAGNTAMATMRRVLDALGIAPVSEAQAGGLLRHLLLRVAPGTGQIGVTLAVRTWPCPRGREVGEALLSVPGVVSVWANHSPKPDSIALGPKSTPLAGHHRLAATVSGIRYVLTPTAFFQTNTPALPLLVDAVGRALPDRMEHLVDLYAGVGMFSLAFARRAGHVTAVEADPRAIRDLTAGARLNGITNIAARAGDAAASRIRGPHPDAVIVDPTRGGLPHSLIHRICAQMAPARIVYVSCSPRALAVDLERFAGGGYRATRIQPVDLFPHTPHLEAVVTLERRASPPAPIPGDGERRRPAPSPSDEKRRITRSCGSRSRPSRCTRGPDAAR